MTETFEEKIERLENNVTTSATLADEAIEAINRIVDEAKDSLRPAEEYGFVSFKVEKEALHEAVPDKRYSVLKVIDYEGKEVDPDTPFKFSIAEQDETKTGLPERGMNRLLYSLVKAIIRKEYEIPIKPRMLFIEAARESVDMNYKELVAAREEYAKED